MYSLITGASSGIGLEFARILASQKRDLILVARSQKILENFAAELKQKYSIQVQTISLDLAEPQACQKLFEQTEAAGWQVHTLINNAGLGDNCAFEEEAWPKILMMVNLNITALLHLTRLYLPKMKAHNSGNILNVASTAAFQPGPYMAVYYATKAFVLSFTEALHEELRGSKIHVTALCPGPTESNFLSVAGLQDAALFKHMKVASTQEVARCGVNALNHNKAVVIQGWRNFIMTQSVRLTPRALVVRMVRLFQEKRAHTRQPS